MTSQRIQFATTSDGLRIAYAATGEGPTLIYMPEWVSHVELQWTGSNGEYLRHLARTHRVVTYDGRGTGLSDRRADDLSVDTRIRDLEAVVEHAGLDRFVLFACSQSSPVAIAYAARHPEHVEKLVLYSPFASGAPSESKAMLTAMLDLMRAEWGVGARTTMSFVHPDANQDELREELTFLRQASSGEVGAGILEENFFRTDVTSELPNVRAPALVVHRRGDKAVPMEAGRRVAALLPNARFVPLEGDHHLAWRGDSGAVLRAVEEFLGVEPEAPAERPSERRRVSAPPVTILFTDMEGSTAQTGRLGDARAQELVHHHNAIVRESLREHGGSEIKHTGDGIMASFPAASAGLECAIDIQRAIARHNRERPDEQVNVRIGLNVGEPVVEEDDLFGTAVQLARRVCDAAEPGQIIASNVVRELVAGKGFLFSEQGETALRGFEDPVRLYSVRWEQ